MKVSFKWRKKPNEVTQGKDLCRGIIYMEKLERLVCVGDDYRVRIYDLKTNKTIKCLQDHDNFLLAISELDEEFFVVGGGDSVVIVYSVETFEKVSSRIVSDWVYNMLTVEYRTVVVSVGDQPNSVLYVMKFDGERLKMIRCLKSQRTEFSSKLRLSKHFRNCFYTTTLDKSLKLIDWKGDKEVISIHVGIFSRTFAVCYDKKLNRDVALVINSAPSDKPRICYIGGVGRRFVKEIDLGKGIIEHILSIGDKYFLIGKNTGALQIRENSKLINGGNEDILFDENVTSTSGFPRNRSCPLNRICPYPLEFQGRKPINVAIGMTRGRVMLGTIFNLQFEEPVSKLDEKERIQYLMEEFKDVFDDSYFIKVDFCGKSTSFDLYKVFCHF